MERSLSTLSNLSRFSLNDEHLVTNAKVEAEIAKAFAENRCFEFYPSIDIVSEISSGRPLDDLNDRFIEIRNKLFDKASDGDYTLWDRLLSNARLSYLILTGIRFIHLALAVGTFATLQNRRFVLIKEVKGSPTIYHISPQTTVISHVGAGPLWSEKPSIYLGLNIFEALAFEEQRNESVFFESFKLLLLVEERAIETGYSHTEVFPATVSRALSLLVDEVIRISITEAEKIEYKEPLKRVPVKRFTEKKRQALLRMLDARMPNDEFNFNYTRNLKAIESIERLARKYKKDGDHESLKEVTRLLVSSSGHDIHDIRNRANIILERIFSPKEFDAPLATNFINLSIGENYRFEFQLPKTRSGYFLRIYKNPLLNAAGFETEPQYFDTELCFEKDKNVYSTTLQFDEYGHFDYLVYKKKRSNVEWLNLSETSGRINVIPDVKGEIILEIFPDIHGHAKTYWKDGSGRPGLVYNENGEVIRLGRFSDITAHLEDLLKRYYITAIYLLGIQKRGSNREDWAFEATSPSPFSPMSLIEIEPSLGDEKEFVELVEKAHSLGIKIFVDIVPHLNRRSMELPPEYTVKCYNGEGILVERASTDGKYGSWDDGKLLNYRMFEIWEWMAWSIYILIEKFDIDGIRFDSAHAVPIMMKKNNYQYNNWKKRTHEEMVEGRVVVNERMDDHFITTGFYDSACREMISVPFHYYLMLHIEKALKEKGKEFFINIAECYWGHEIYLARTGIMPYNSSLFKICENIIHGKTDVREIYHIYDNHFPRVLPRGTELLGILGNHDERRALNTFGQRGLRAAVALTMFMSSIILDYEGSAEGEGWKVFLDNIYVNWNQFENASHRSVDSFYKEWYSFHRRVKGKGYLIWANNNMVAAAMKFSPNEIWIGAFNFAESDQHVSLQFDNLKLPIQDDVFYRVIDPLYSHVTGTYSYYTGQELRHSRIETFISYTERVKLLQLDVVYDAESCYHDFLRDSFLRLCVISDDQHFKSTFIYKEIASNIDSYEEFSDFILKHLIKLFWKDDKVSLELGLKRVLYHLYMNEIVEGETVLEYIKLLSIDNNVILSDLGKMLTLDNQTGSLIFLSAEAEPFSKSGGLANVVYELPRELVKQGEDVYVITGLYQNGDEKSVKKMRDAIDKYNVTYTERNVRFKIQNIDYEVGVHYAEIEGVKYFLLDHYEFFDGLYWGITGFEKMRRRIAFARASIEVIVNFGLKPYFTFTNDAFTGIFNGLVRCDPYYINNPNFSDNTFIHVIHNGGWQYFDSFALYENGFNLFELFNLPFWRSSEFCDPVNQDRINCMAAGVRFSDRVMTVSPSYAMQIEFACDGLERILNKVTGISNAIGRDLRKRIDQRFIDSGFRNEYMQELMDAIDMDLQLREKIEDRYPEILNGMKKIDSIPDEKRRYILNRVVNKMMLQIDKGLKVDPDMVLLCMIHRISEQKGFQLLLDISEGIFKHMECQIVIGGAVSSGDNRGSELAHGLYLLSQFYPDRVSVNFGFQDISIPLLSSDIFCMPSLNEPGGISQLEAFACGCLVVARATGGLRDTVQPIQIKGDDVTGNGFLFSDFSSWSFYDAVKRAVSFLKENDDETIYKSRINAEKSVSFWDKPAREYIKKIYKFKEIIRVI